MYLVSLGKYKTAAITNIFHAEFSSILLRSYPGYLDKEAWLQVNPAGFTYLGSGVKAIQARRFSQRFNEALHAEGFLHEYARASIEEDFNSNAARLFTGDAAFWSASKRYPKMKAKAELAIAFHGKQDASFTREFFLARRESNAAPPKPINPAE